MQRFKFGIGILAFLLLAVAVIFVLSGERALVTHPKGLIAHKELDLIATNYILMLIIVIPTFILLFVTVRKYRSKNPKAKYDPEHSFGAFGEALMWIIPFCVIAVMATITWFKAHELDPYVPIKSSVPPLKIQVVAMDWKWLFIYPEQGIATVNFVQFPEQTPIHFELAADGSPMNSFWIPQLSGQIYAMTGMTTQLHLMADGPGEYSGKAAEINGKGYASMTFVVKSISKMDFEDWIAKVKQSSLPLTDEIYKQLATPSEKYPITLYSSVDGDLFNKIVMKYMHHQ